MIEALEWKPCPFCGGLDLSITHKETFDSQMANTGSAVTWVYCKDYVKCGAELTYYTKRDTFEEALRKVNEKWNRRANE